MTAKILLFPASRIVRIARQDPVEDMCVMVAPSASERQYKIELLRALFREAKAAK